ncbi:hypothetical protein [Streptomyces sp. HC307]|uniref:hypothetical protein n=1 Tax=Streptomyces flavusporus TaxID=3385496 RepID=UPI003916D4DD
MHTYNLELQEAEDLNASAVEIGGLTLATTAYKEWTDEGTLVLSFVTETAGEANQQLEELVVARGETYYDVIRRGVSDTPVRMRFSRTLWQETESGSMRHNLSLVADEGSEPSKPGPFALLNEPQLSRTTEAAVANAQALAVLVDELQAWLGRRSAGSGTDLGERSRRVTGAGSSCGVVRIRRGHRAAS